MITEEWRGVSGYGGLYEVSNHGRIKSLKRSVKHRAGTMLVNEKILSQSVVRGGYLKIHLCCNGEPTATLVHRLVLEAFVGPCPGGMEACHNDGDPTNNNVGNLRWDTRTCNHADKAVHGTSYRGERHFLAKLTEDQVKQIRDLCDFSDLTQSEIARMYGVDSSNISRIHTRENWGWL